MTTFLTSILIAIWTLIGIFWGWRLVNWLFRRFRHSRHVYTTRPPEHFNCRCEQHWETRILAGTREEIVESLQGLLKPDPRGCTHDWDAVMPELVTADATSWRRQTVLDLLTPLHFECRKCGLIDKSCEPLKRGLR